MVSGGHNFYNYPIALASMFSGEGMVYYSMQAPQLNAASDFESPHVQKSSIIDPVIRTTFPESWIFDMELDNG